MELQICPKLKYQREGDLSLLHINLFEAQRMCCFFYNNLPCESDGSVSPFYFTIYLMKTEFSVGVQTHHAWIQKFVSFQFESLLICVHVFSISLSYDCYNNSVLLFRRRHINQNAIITPISIYVSYSYNKEYINENKNKNKM